MLTSEFETTMVLRPDLSGEAVEATLDKVREAVKVNGGKLLIINHWGKKKLAYEIKKQTRGIYVHTHYLGGGHVVSEVERNLGLADSVLRFLTVNLATGVDPKDRQETAYVAPRYDELHRMAEEEERREAARERGEGRDEVEPKERVAEEEAAEPADEGRDVPAAEAEGEE